MPAAANPITTTTSSTAPLQIALRFQLDRPPAETFELVSTRLADWFRRIHGVTWNHARSTRGAATIGACSERVCDFGGKQLVEEIVEFEAGRRYSYRIDFARSQLKMPMVDHLASFAVSAADGGGGVVDWHTHFHARWFVPAALLRWQLRDKLMRPAVDDAIRSYGGRWLAVR